MNDNWTFTSESVTEGHPDKMADQISDAVLDAMLTTDPNSRVACETLITTGMVVVAGEVTTTDYVDIPETVRDTVCEIGYDREDFGFDGRTCGVMVALDAQSTDIARGVDASEEARTGSSDDDALARPGAGARQSQPPGPDFWSPAFGGPGRARSDHCWAPGVAGAQSHCCHGF